MDPSYRSDINRDVRPAARGEFAPISIGPSLSVDPPVVLAPMAGVTNYPFRRLCRRFGAGLYVSEMITARGIIRGDRKTLFLARFGPDESPRSIQLYASQPDDLREASRILSGEGLVDHIDLNFGCPVRKVTSHGGGAAIPLRPRLMAALVRAAVEGAAGLPVTIKFRMGLDEGHPTWKSSGRIGEEEGCRAVALHARTAAQLYDGEASWETIAALKASVRSIPVLGNGDIWEAWDALRMMRRTGCDGVVVGRGCLGRPWLFRDLADVFAGREPSDPPNLGGVIDVALDHAHALCDHFGEDQAMFQMRKWCTWYTKSFHGSAQWRNRLMKIRRLDELSAILGELNRSTPFPPSAMRVKRGKRSGTQTVSLPPGYLDRLDEDTPPDRTADELLAGDGG